MNARPETRKRALYAQEVMLYQAQRKKAVTERGYRYDEAEARKEAERIKARIQMIEEIDDEAR